MTTPAVAGVRLCVECWIDRPTRPYCTVTRSSHVFVELCPACGADEMTDHPDGESGQCGDCGRRS
jgi:hypothetical protein